MIVWDDLRILLALARNPSLRVAAETLNIDPTTVTRRLARLSETLDTTLFERRGSNYYLTERGADYVAYVERAEASIIEGFETTAAGGPSGLIRIGAPEAFSSLFLAPRLPEFQKANPRVQVDLITPSWVPDPLKREVDLAILLERPVRGPLNARKLLESTLQLYATEEYLANHPPIRTTADLKGHVYIGYVRGIPSSSQALEYTLNPLPGVVASIRTTSLSVHSSLVREGKGVALLPYYVGAGIPNHRVICPEEICIPQSFWLVVRQDVRQSARVIAFIKWLTTIVEENRTFFGEPSRMRD